MATSTARELADFAGTAAARGADSPVQDKEGGIRLIENCDSHSAAHYLRRRVLAALITYKR